jgi:hypothetical protein
MATVDGVFVRARARALGSITRASSHTPDRARQIVNSWATAHGLPPVLSCEVSDVTARAFVGVHRYYWAREMTSQWFEQPLPAVLPLFTPAARLRDIVEQYQHLGRHPVVPCTQVRVNSSCSLSAHWRQIIDEGLLEAYLGVELPGVTDARRAILSP